jgi:hypothetical protein
MEANERYDLLHIYQSLKVILLFEGSQPKKYKLCMLNPKTLYIRCSKVT